MMTTHVHLVKRDNDMFIVVYDNPCSCKLTRKSNSFFMGGLYKSIFHLEQKTCHRLICEAYCFWAPFD